MMLLYQCQKTLSLKTTTAKGRKKAMTTYRINEAHNGIEITFDSKPEAATLDALKGEGFRWHRAGGYWYAKQTPERLALAQSIAETSGEEWRDIPGATTAPSGYKWQSNGKSRFGGEYKNRLVKAEEPQTPQSRIKIYYNGFKLNGSKELTKCNFSVNGSDAVSIYADGYGAELPRDLFEVKNDTDYYTDYFDKDRATVAADHPLFKYVYYAAKKQAAHWAKRQLADVEKRAARWPEYADSYRKEAERARATVAEFEAMTDPGQPTAEDLAKVDSVRQEAENRRRAEEHAAQLAERERVINQRTEGRRHIEAIANAYPIEDGAPVVEIPFSEYPAFYSWTDSEDKKRVEVTINPDGTRTENVIIEQPRRRLLLSVTAADKVLDYYDKAKSQECRGYAKTDFIITWTDESGDPWSYEGRYDLGDCDGGLIEHIARRLEWDRTHDRFGHPTTDPQKTSDSRAAWVDLLRKYRQPETVGA